MIKVNGKKLYLSKRKAGDVLTLINYCSTNNLPVDKKPEQLSSEELISFISVMAQTVSDSLKATYLNLSQTTNLFMKLINNSRKKKYQIFFDGQGASYLIENCDPIELGNAHNEVLELDNIKKKVVQQMESLSAMELEKVS